MKKTSVNFISEGIGLALFLSVIASGLILRYRLPPGSGGEGPGRGWRRQALTQLDLGRHDWGAIHFYLALGFIAIMILHLALHWRWVWGMMRGRTGRGVSARGVLYLAATLILLLILALPWLIPVRG